MLKTLITYRRRRDTDNATIPFFGSTVKHDELNLKVVAVSHQSLNSTLKKTRKTSETSSNFVDFEDYGEDAVW